MHNFENDQRFLKDLEQELLLRNLDDWFLNRQPLKKKLDVETALHRDFVSLKGL